MAEAATLVAGDTAPCISAQRPIDLVHLARMTFGDRTLEREGLGLFERQACLLIGRMKELGTAAVPGLAHTLKGSARGIGAWQVASAAEMLESAAADGEAAVHSALTVLETATEEARGAIADLLRNA